MAIIRIINGVNGVDEKYELIPQLHLITDISFKNISEADIQLLMEIAEEKDAEITLTMDQAQELAKVKGIKPKIQIIGKTAKDISTEELSKLQQKLEITGVLLKKDIKSVNIGAGQSVYNPEIYKLCRKKIDDIISDINIERFENMPNRDELVFVEVIKRLAEDVSYNYDESANKQEKISSRNMEGPLLLGHGVCGGYSEVLAQVLECCDIESEVVLGLGDLKTKNGHAWNQVKLNDKWYNVDFTNARPEIIEGREPTDFLVSDKDFYIGSLYSNKDTINKRHNCDESKTGMDIVEMLYGERSAKILRITEMFSPKALQDFRMNYSYVQKKYIRHSNIPLNEEEEKWENRMLEMDAKSYTNNEEVER